MFSKYVWVATRTCSCARASQVIVGRISVVTIFNALFFSSSLVQERMSPPLPHRTSCSSSCPLGRKNARQCHDKTANNSNAISQPYPPSQASYNKYDHHHTATIAGDPIFQLMATIRTSSNPYIHSPERLLKLLSRRKSFKAFGNALLAPANVHSLATNQWAHKLLKLDQILIRTR